MGTRAVRNVFCLVVVVACLTALAYKYSVRIEEGVVGSLTLLPIVGRFFDDETLQGNLTYRADFGKRQVQVRSRIDSDEFDKLLEKLGRDAINYDSGFPGSGIGGDKMFLPSTERVFYSAWLLENSRIGIEIMFEPESRSLNNLYINVR
jgi:hypothetical protein